MKARLSTVEIVCLSTSIDTGENESILLRGLIGFYHTVVSPFCDLETSSGFGATNWQAILSDYWEYLVTRGVLSGPTNRFYRVIGCSQ